MVRLSGLGEERVWKPSPLRRVDILAMGESSLEFVHNCYHQGPRKPDHEVWTINSGPLAFAYDKVWNMHDLDELAKVEDHVNYKELYRTIEKPLITVKALEELPTSLEFPLAEFIEEFGCLYTATAVCYMIAGALMCGVKELGIWGADYNYKDKGSFEKGRGSVEFWLGVAHARGVKLQPAQSSTLMDMCYRVPECKGSVGYGVVYGYFDTQPIVQPRKAGGYSLQGFQPKPQLVPEEGEI